MKKTVILYIAAAVAVIAASFFLFRPQTAGRTVNDSEILLFTRYDCPHCRNVEKYLEEREIKDKITPKEIHDSANAALFLKKAKQCGIAEADLGVPMLWAEERCYIGEQNIIDYLSGK